MAFSYRTAYNDEGIVVTRLELPMLDGEYSMVAKQAIISTCSAVSRQNLISYLDCLMYESHDEPIDIPEQMLSDLDEAREDMCRAISNAIIALATLADTWGLDIQEDINTRIFDRL